MAGLRDLARVIDQVTRVGAKVVLVGDHHQLPEVAAGGGFRAALDTLGGRVAELTVNRRQQHEWEQAALDQLRHGDVATAFAAYQQHGRVVLADDTGDLHARAIADWRQLRGSGVTLMLAGTRAEARLLNQTGPRTCSPRPASSTSATSSRSRGRVFAPGEQVVLRRNDPAQHLANGERFAVDNGMRGHHHRPRPRRSARHVVDRRGRGARAPLRRARLGRLRATR